MLAEFQKQLSDTLAEIKSQGLYKTERIITRPQNAKIEIAGGRRVLNMCANNYLGLADHPALIAAAKEALDTHGFGMASVRFICGTQDIHKELEAALTKFLGTEDTILYPSCFRRQRRLVRNVADREDAVISDELNHASIIDGVRLCKAQRYRYKHNDMADLEAQVARGERRALPTDRDRRRVSRWTARSPNLGSDLRSRGKIRRADMVDDAHAAGFIGKTGRGTHEYRGVMGRSTSSPARSAKRSAARVAVTRAGEKRSSSCCGNVRVPILFSNTVAPPIVAASLESA